MLRIMLCGASDTDAVQHTFARVAGELGGEPWHYLSGQIRYHNTATASWIANSRDSVRSADFCVFAVLAAYGEITWTVELKQALDDGLPFIILCLDRTYEEYLALKRNVDITTAIQDPAKRNLVQMLDEIESVRQLTIVQFNMDTFGEIFRREAAKLFAFALATTAQRAKREALANTMRDGARLSTRELLATEEIALDEFEEKAWRKLAVETLAEHGVVGPETVSDLIRSREQGIQRLAIDKLAQLYAQRPPDADFVQDCVALANNADDVGVARRMIAALFDLDVASAIHGLLELDVTEIGLRRRLAALLVEREHMCAEPAVRAEAVELLTRCIRKTKDEAHWISRATECLERLQKGNG
jgi:hypothetical protein